MSSKLVSVYNVKKGDILDDDIFNQAGIKLLSKDTVVKDTDTFVETLENVGVVSVKIKQEIPFDPKEEEIKETLDLYSTNCDTLKKRFRNILYNKEKFNSVDLSLQLSGILKLTKSSLNVVQLMQKMKDSKDHTYAHSNSLSLTCHLIAKMNNLPENETKEVAMAGLLSDIGKLKIPSHILEKQGSLTKEEILEIQKHPLYSYQFLLEFDFIPDRVKQGILYHHEFLDGSGYPRKLKGKEIPFYSRIITIADIYTALTAARAYRKKMTPFTALDVIKRDFSQKIDLDLFYSFHNKLSQFFIGQNVKLNDQREGTIVYIPKINSTRPVIQIDQDGSLVDLQSSENRDLIIDEFR